MLKTAPVIHTYTPVSFQMPVDVHDPDDMLVALQQLNHDLRIERNAHGEFIIMPPASSDTGRRNATLLISFGIWAKKNGEGVVFDSSTGFTLLNGAVRSPDVAWIRQERWQALSAIEKRRFAPISPDFLIELRSRTDQLSILQQKMAEYMSNGVQLAWLIDPIDKQVHIYEANQEIKILQNPSEVSGEPLLKDFVLELSDIWELE